jgi:phosphatidylglycerol:prolipoprotein diacylglycerol transferase
VAVKGPPVRGNEIGHMDFFVIPYPAIDPVALQIGPVSIRWYGLAYMAGILCGWLYGRHLVATNRLWGGKSPITVTEADDFLLWITLGIVIGGRLGFVLFYEPSFFWQNPSQIPAVWNGGMSFHGGLLGVILAVYVFSRVKHINPLSLGDVASAATPFGLWVILRIATHRYKALERPGTVFGLFLIFYGIFRSLVEEFAREPHAGHPMDVGIFTPGIVYSIPMVLLGAWLVWRARRKPALAS